MATKKRTKQAVTKEDVATLASVLASAGVETKYMSNEALKELLAKIKDKLGGSDLVSAGEDETYVMKAVDAAGELLVGFKESGEVYVPTGLAEDAYALINALYEKLADAVDYMATLPTTGGNDLVSEGSDSEYVLKMQDSEGNLLQGFKENGEVETPTGVGDDAYALFSAVYDKLKEISDYLTVIHEKIYN